MLVCTVWYTAVCSSAVFVLFRMNSGPCLKINLKISSKKNFVKIGHDEQKSQQEQALLLRRCSTIASLSYCHPLPALHQYSIVLYGQLLALNRLHSARGPGSPKTAHRRYSATNASAPRAATARCFNGGGTRRGWALPGGDPAEFRDVPVAGGLADRAGCTHALSLVTEADSDRSKKISLIMITYL